MSGPRSIPSVEEIAEEPRLALGLPLQVRRLLKARALTAAHAIDIADLQPAAPEPAPAPRAAEEARDRMLTEKEAAGLVRLHPRVLQRHRLRGQAPVSEWVVKYGTIGVVRYSEKKIREHLAREAAGAPGPNGPMPRRRPSRRPAFSSVVNPDVPPNSPAA